jgi:hypothetical protein
VTTFEGAVIERLDAIARQFQFSTMQIDRETGVPGDGDLIAQMTSPTWITIARCNYHLRDCRARSKVTFNDPDWWIREGRDNPRTFEFAPWEDDKINAMFDCWRDLLRDGRKRLNAENTVSSWGGKLAATLGGGK